jgi:L-amino acid N-acyltransferase YncA
MFSTKVKSIYRITQYNISKTIAIVQLIMIRIRIEENRRRKMHSLNVAYYLIVLGHILTGEIVVDFERPLYKFTSLFCGKYIFVVRIATKEDAPGMLNIYTPFILNSGITQETEAPTVEDFQKRILANLEERPWLVCEIDKEIAGYAYAGKHRDRKGYQWCTEPSVYLSEKYFGLGISNALYRALFDILKLQGYVNAYAVITLPNDRSIAFHKKFGFDYLTTYKKIGYKLGQWHDVGWMFYEINSHANEPLDPIKFPNLDRSLIDSVLLKASTLIKK